MVFNRDNFEIRTLDDEILADQLCQDILSQFYESLLAAGTPARAASTWASAADYFVRDYLIGSRQRNPFAGEKGIVRQFAGTWYIINTLEPSVEQLADYLEGVKAFYDYLAATGCITADFARALASECDDVSFYEQRIESFWQITGDGYGAWERECPLAGRSELAGKNSENSE